MLISTLVARLSSITISAIVQTAKSMQRICRNAYQEKLHKNNIALASNNVALVVSCYYYLTKKTAHQISKR